MVQAEGILNEICLNSLNRDTGFEMGMGLESSQ